MAFYDKDKIKSALSEDDIFRITEHLGGEPTKTSEGIILRTICHNGPHGGSEKLYYYHNTGLFNCYTGCGSMDIFELVTRVKKAETDTQLTFYQSMDFVAKFFNLDGVEGERNLLNLPIKNDMQILSDYKLLLNEKAKLVLEYKIYNDALLHHLSFVAPAAWVREGIGIEAMKKYGIKYYGTDHKIVIPHYNLQNDLIGIRGRTMIEADAVLYGKYMPLKVGNVMYNHPLSHNLYGLNHNLENINQCKKLIIFEGEKSTLHYETMFGAENNIAVATCGNSLSLIQEEIIKKFCNIDEIIIAYDKDFKAIGDKDFKRSVASLQRLAARLNNYFKVSVLFDKDKENPKLEHKDAPIDQGKEVFKYLFDNRIFL